MIAHFFKMALKALLRFKLHSTISLLSLLFGFLCFISAVLLSNYTQSFDQHFPNAGKIYNVIMRNTGALGGPDKFPIINEPASRYMRTYFPEIPNIVRASTGGGSNDVVVDGRAITLFTRYVEPRFFDIFPVPTQHGLATGAELPPNSALITEEAAIRVFGRTDVVGERLLLNNRSDIVIAGVAAKQEYPSHLQSSIPLFQTDIFIPMEISENIRRERRIAAGADPDADNWGNQSDYVYIEFPEDMDVNVADFNQRLDEFVKATLPADRSEFMSYELQPINQLVTSQIAFVTGGFNITDILVVAGALVLLIGCLNYSNLVIAQLSLRSQEIGVQKILGAKRGMLVAQYCFESFLFVMLALSLTLVLFAVVLLRMQASGMVGVSSAMLFDVDLWLALLAVIAVIVAIAGGYPALRTAMVPLVSMMRPKGSSGYSSRLRSLMVGVQFFISGTLMILAVIMFSQNSAMTQQLDGEVADPKIVVTTPVDTYTADPEVLATQLKQHPGVLSVTQVDIQPWEISMSTISMARTADLNEVTVELSNQNIGYEFTQTMDVPLLAGRDFSRERSSDLFPSNSELTTSSGPYALLINDGAAQNLGWENAAEAIGESVYRHLEPPSVLTPIAIEMTIVGSVGDQKFRFINFESFGVSGGVYTLRPNSANYMIIKISKDNVSESLRHIDDTWNRLMPTIPLKREFVDSLFHEAYNLFLGISASIGALSIFGFFIASIGLLGNATFITNIRRKEVGIRKVMGASSGTLLRMLLLDFAKPIMIANAFAWPLGYVIGNSYTSLFAAQSDLTLLPFLVSFCLSVFIAVVAVISQSWKSAHVRPAMVLRYE
ncbi:MAG: putative ABC transport system permease protein [Pseudohongiellaceae bacterium]|jgi:putative ABC transport system permease protein